MISLRNSEFGYRNINPFFISFDSLVEYIRDIKAFIEAGELLNAKEYYSAVRLKPADSNDYFASLRENGISYFQAKAFGSKSIGAYRHQPGNDALHSFVSDLHAR